MKNLPFRFLSQDIDRLTVRFDKDHLKEVTSNQESFNQIEVIKDHQLGYALSNSLDRKSLLSKAICSASFGDKVDYSYPYTIKFPNVDLFSQSVAGLSADQLIGMGQEIIEKIKQTDPEILLSVFLSRGVGRNTLETSSQISYEEKETALTVYAEGERVKEGDILQIGQEFVWRDQTFNLDDFTGELGDKFRLAKNVVKVEPEKMTVVFTPQALTTLLSFIERALSAESVYKKLSKWKDEMGKQVADPRFSLLDDPTVNFALGSTLGDDEGFGGGLLSLVENGVLKNFYTDLKNAEKLQIKPNGRGFGIPGNPSLTNIMVSGGIKSSEKIIQEIDKGILVDQIIGGGQDNPYAGDFSLSVHLGFLINHGEIAGRVKNLLISGNIFEMIKDKVGDISSDRKWVDGSGFLPFISFLKTRVTG